MLPQTLAIRVCHPIASPRAAGLYVQQFFCGQVHNEGRHKKSKAAQSNNVGEFFSHLRLVCLVITTVLSNTSIFANRKLSARVNPEGNPLLIP